MAKKDKDEIKDEGYGEYIAKQLVAAPPQTYAVFFDAEEASDDPKDRNSGWCYFPTILFAIGKVVNGDEVMADGVVRGMMSNHGGLELVEETEELQFIGYWTKSAQPEFDDFLADHDVEQAPRDDEDEENDGEDDEGE